MITSYLIRKKKRKSHVWDSILRPIFDNENVGIKLNSWNTKLFIIELTFQIFLNHSITCKIQKLWSKHGSHMITPNLMREKKCRFHVWDSILRSIFDNENVGIRFNSWNSKLFIIELSFQIFLNHSILMLDSKVMIKTLKLYDHTKSDERKKTQIPCLG